MANVGHAIVKVSQQSADTRPAKRARGFCRGRGVCKNARVDPSSRRLKPLVQPCSTLIYTTYLRIIVIMGDVLRQAVINGRMDDMIASLDAGTDIDSKDEDGWSATYYAAQQCRTRCLKLLIERGADVNAASNSGQSPAHQSSQQGETEALQALLNAGANPNAVDGSGNTPLHNAAKRGSIACATMLMEAGARRDIKNNDGKTPADMAAAWAMAEMTATIQSFIQPRARDLIYHRRAVEAKRDAGMVFMAASEGRPMELARRLRLGKLAGGLEIKGSVTLDDGSSSHVLPVEAARMGGHDDCVKLLEDATG